MESDSGHGGTDLGRRLQERRHRAGLTIQDAASRAGMADSYLAYLETSPDAAPTTAALARLAAALDTTTHAITGAALDLPPGRQLPDQHPVLRPLDAAECRGFLGTGGVGRFLFVAPRGPVAMPVNFRMLGDDIVFRTEDSTTLAAAAAAPPQPVSFEVDHLDEALGEGWSVLVSGHAHVVTDAAERDEVASLEIAPWAGGAKRTYVRIVAGQVTGRQIRAGE
jgi:transcriptional regulator with XRE-family HTH domain